MLVWDVAGRYVDIEVELSIVEDRQRLVDLRVLQPNHIETPKAFNTDRFVESWIRLPALVEARSPDARAPRRLPSAIPWPAALTLAAKSMAPWPQARAWSRSTTSPHP
jgi:hypothetical protein